MQTSFPRPHILFIDGLPGSVGKSMAAEAVGGYLSNSQFFLETAPNHPLLVAAPDRMGAAFADIHKLPGITASLAGQWRSNEVSGRSLLKTEIF